MSADEYKSTPSICFDNGSCTDKNYPQTMFFVNAPGGYGKTFLIEALLSTVRGMGTALAVASSGIRAELLGGG